MRVAHYRVQSNLSYFYSIQGSPAAASRKNAAHDACSCNKQLLQAATTDVLAHSMCKRAVEEIALTSSSMRKKKIASSCNFRNSEAFALCIPLLLLRFLRLLRFALTRLCTGKLYRSVDKAGSRSGRLFIGCSYLNQLLNKLSGDL